MKATKLTNGPEKNVNAPGGGGGGESRILIPPPVEPSTGRKAKSSRWQRSAKSHRMDHTIVVQQGETMCHLEVAYSVCHPAVIPI